MINFVMRRTVDRPDRPSLSWVSLLGLRPRSRTRVWTVAAFLLYAASLCLPESSYAAEVEIALNPRAGTIEDDFILTVSVRGASSRKIEAPEFEKTPVVSVEGTGRSVRSSFINGNASFEITFSYQVTPSANLRPGTYALPKGSMVVDNKRLQIEPQKFVILASSAESDERAKSRAAGVDFTHTVSSLEPYVGEQVLYQAKIASGPSLGGGNLEDIELKGFWRESLGQNAEQKRAIGDVILHTFGEALFPVHPGPVEIPGRGLRAKIRTRIPRRAAYRSLFDELMMPPPGSFDLKDVRLVTAPLNLNVRELPPVPPEMSDAPNKQNVPVGHVVMESGVDRTSVPLGDSVSFTVTVEGDANLRPFELPGQPASESQIFKRYEDKPKIDIESTQSRVSMKKTFSIALVPLKAGTFELPKYRLLAFDPGKGSYYWVETGGGKVTVSPATGAEKLVVHGTTTGTPAAGPTAAPLGVSDIRPQHEGASLVASDFVPSRSLRLWIIICAPLLALALIAVFRRSMHGDTSASDLERSAQELRQALNDSSANPAALLRALENFLRDQGIRRKGSIDPGDIEQLVQRRTGNQENAKRIMEGVKLLQRSVYGGQSYPADLQYVRESIGSLLEVLRHGH